jgi:hypothetical protein
VIRQLCWNLSERTRPPITAQMRAREEGGADFNPSLFPSLVRLVLDLSSTQLILGYFRRVLSHVMGEGDLRP